MSIVTDHTIFHYSWKIKDITVVLSRCTQQGETRNMQTRIKLKITVYNQDKAGLTRQGRHRQEHRGVTSRPDEKELNRQELNTQGKKHIITYTHLEQN